MPRSTPDVPGMSLAFGATGWSIGVHARYSARGTSLCKFMRNPYFVYWGVEPMRLNGRGSAELRSADRCASPENTPSETVPPGQEAEADEPEGPRRPIQFIPRRSWLWAGPDFVRLIFPVVELALIALFAVWVAKPVLAFDAHMIPGGAEYWVNILANTFWDRVETCGECALWNGSMRGGYPAIADTQSAILHPIVALPALALGWVNGAKVTIALALFLAGFAQWWLARVLGLGMVARVWSGCLAATAGSMTGRMEDGGVVLLVSGAACAMILPPFIRLARDGRRRTAAILGLTIGLSLVSGQAYLQVASAAIAPFLVFALAYRNPLGPSLLVRRYALAGVIGLLVASPLLIPYLHIMASYTKDIDPYFGQAQPLGYIPLNFVIDDQEFFRIPILGKQPFPYLYTAYVGWMAVLLAFAGVTVLWLRRERRLAIALGIALFLPLWFASAQPLRWLAGATEGAPSIHEFLIGFRSVPLFAGLAVTPLLGFAAIGLDWVWRSLRSALWIAMDRRDSAPALKLDPRWLLVVLLVLTTDRARDFSKHWIHLVPDGSAKMAPVLDALETDDLQWVNTPFGMQDWWGPAIQDGLKVSISPTAWSWNPRTLPPALLVAEVNPPEGAFSPKEAFGEVTVYAAETGNEYAAIVHPDGTRTVCSAHGTGGSIDVDCNAPQAGRLVVLEHMASGWKAEIDGEQRALTRSDVWIAVDVPAGESHIQLRYKPWDVPVGIALMVAGLGLAGGAMWYDWRERNRGSPSRSARGATP